MSPRPNPIADLLVKHLARDLVMGIEDALYTGARRGYAAVGATHPGHRAHSTGQMRHFHCNEAFWDALEAGGATPTPLNGNQIVVGQAGIFTIGRFHSDCGLQGGRRSKARSQLAEANEVIEKIIAPDLFQEAREATSASVFFMTSSNRHYNGDEDQSPLSSIEIGVPRKDMNGWVFHESIRMFLRRYETEVVTQEDNATARLKVGVVKRQDQEGTQ